MIGVPIKKHSQNTYEVIQRLQIRSYCQHTSKICCSLKTQWKKETSATARYMIVFVASCRPIENISHVGQVKYPDGKIACYVKVITSRLVNLFFSQSQIYAITSLDVTCEKKMCKFPMLPLAICCFHSRCNLKTQKRLTTLI